MALPDPVTGMKGRPVWSQVFATKEACDRDQRRVRREIDEGTYTSDGGVTVGQWLDEWVERRERLGRKRSTTVGYRSIIEEHLKPAIGGHRLGLLRVEHVQGMLDRIASTPSTSTSTKGKPPEAGTLRNIRACLRAALGEAVRQRKLSVNVAALVELPSPKRAQPVQVAGGGLVVFLRHVEEDPLAAMWLMDAVYGMRRGELLGLGWDGVDTTAKLVRVTTTLLEISGKQLLTVDPNAFICPRCAVEHPKLIFDTVKSAAGERTFPLVPEVEAALMAHQLEQDAQRIAYGDDYVDHGLVFAQPDGNPIRPSTASRWFKARLVASGAAKGMKAVPSLKALRSSMVTALSEEGTPLEIIAKITGHSGTQVTKDHYLSATAERTRTEFGIIAARLTGGRSDHQSDHR